MPDRDKILREIVERNTFVYLSKMQVREDDGLIASKRNVAAVAREAWDAALEHGAELCDERGKRSYADALATGDMAGLVMSGEANQCAAALRQQQHPKENGGKE